MSFTHQQCHGSGAVGSTAGRSGMQAVSRRQGMLAGWWAGGGQEARRSLLPGEEASPQINCFPKPCLWPLRLHAQGGVWHSRRHASSCGSMPRYFSKSCSTFPVLFVRLLQQLPTNVEESTNIMQQFLPPSGFGIFSTFFYLV